MLLEYYQNILHGHQWFGHHVQMAACLTACITHAEINLNNNLLCLSLVLFPFPHPNRFPFHYMFLLTPAANLTHPVTLCEHVLHCTFRPAHLTYL